MKAALVIALTLLALASWALWTPDLNRTVLEQRYLQAPSDMVQVLGTPLHVRESGPKDAPAVLLLHGFGSSLETWETWSTALSAHLRVLRLDLPGSGLSPPDSRQDYSDARSIALIRALRMRAASRKPIWSAIRSVGASPGLWQPPNRNAWTNWCCWPQTGLPARVLPTGSRPRCPPRWP